MGKSEWIEKWLRTINTILLFVEECCMLDVTASIERGWLYRVYWEWCKSNGLSRESKYRFYVDVLAAHDLVDCEGREFLGLDVDPEKVNWDDGVWSFRG